MPYTDTNGVKYYKVDRQLVVDENGARIPSLTGGKVYAVAGGAALPLLSFPSETPLTELVTSPDGLTSDVYVAFPDDAQPGGYIDWDDDGIPPQAVTAAPDEVAAWLATQVQTQVDAAVDTATQGLPANVDALTETVTELDASAVKSKAGFAVSGIAVIGGTYGLPTESEAGVLYFRIPDAS